MGFLLKRPTHFLGQIRDRLDHIHFCLLVKKTGSVEESAGFITALSHNLSGRKVAKRIVAVSRNPKLSVANCLLRFQDVTTDNFA